jgi:hypothetical protein
VATPTPRFTAAMWSHVERTTASPWADHYDMLRIEKRREPRENLTRGVRRSGDDEHVSVQGRGSHIVGGDRCMHMRLDRAAGEDAAPSNGGELDVARIGCTRKPQRDRVAG